MQDPGRLPVGHRDLPDEMRFRPEHDRRRVLQATGYRLLIGRPRSTWQRPTPYEKWR
jgi:hypothetical protein